jgi:site-specific DNA-adenine methylase
MPPKRITENTLFYGDNLPIVREYIPTESVDLVYLDPPFNPNRSYNVLFRDESGHINAGDVRDLIGTVEQEKAALGIFITLDPPTAPMETAAVTAGYYLSPGWNQD